MRCFVSASRAYAALRRDRSDYDTSPTSGLARQRSCCQLNSASRLGLNVEQWESQNHDFRVEYNRIAAQHARRDAQMYSVMKIHSIRLEQASLAGRRAHPVQRDLLSAVHASGLEFQAQLSRAGSATPTVLVRCDRLQLAANGKKPASVGGGL